MRAISISVVFLIGILAMIVPIVMGVYTYKDARKRNMNPWLWTLIVILVPSFIGFIIYLIVRNNYSDMKCPACEAPVREEYISCPSCGIKLRETCESCGYGVERFWKVCPRCSQPLSHSTQVSFPMRKKDRSLPILVTLVLVIAVLVCVFLMFSLTMARTDNFNTNYTSNYMSSSSYVYYEEDEVTEATFASQELKDWYKECMSGDEAWYILEYRKENTDGSTIIKQFIYWPDVKTDETVTPIGLNGKDLMYKVMKGNIEGTYPWCLVTIEVLGSVHDTMIAGNGGYYEPDVTCVEYDFVEELELDIKVD